MNGDAANLPLEELDEQDVRLLVEICRQVDPYTDRPTKSLWDAYYAAMSAQHRSHENDQTVYPYINNLGGLAHSARTRGDPEEPVDYVRLLRQLLKAVDTELEFDDETSEQEGAVQIQSPPRQRQPKQVKEDRRRVSFDDARYEEHWLSEYSETIEQDAPQMQGLLRLPPIRTGQLGQGQRARSISSERFARQPATQQYKHEMSPAQDVSDPDGPADSDLYKPMQIKADRDDQLGEILEAFSYTSTIRVQRRSLHLWHDATLRIQQRNWQAFATATAYDSRKLAQSTLDEWHNAMVERRQARLQIAKREAEFARWERRAGLGRDAMLVRRCMEHWYVRHLALKHKALRANQLLLAMRYFRRWREIAVENATKARSILTRKMLALWRDRTARRQLVNERAIAHYEITIQRRTYWDWFWLFCTRRVEVSYGERIQRKGLSRLAQKVRDFQAIDRQAVIFRTRRLLGSTMQNLRQRFSAQQQAQTTAQAHYERNERATTLKTLHLQARLAPLQKTMSLRVTLTLQRKAFAVWHLHLDLNRQAVDVDRRRVLHDAWTNWNDALRCRALAQRMDERILVENLYRWVLQERLSLFRRARDAEILKRSLLALRGVSHDLDTRLQQRETIYKRNSDRRRMAFGMLRLNIALRQREDAERAATEFANSRTLPRLLESWVEQSDHARQLARWAADARFYCLCTSTLKKWKERTVEHKHQRRRDAYVEVRARIKLRLVGSCFVQWRSRCMEVHSMNGEGERRAHARTLSVGAQAFEDWRQLAQARLAQAQQADTIDRQRLLSSALAAMQLRHASITDLDRTALSFHHDTELDLQSSALKRLQWSTFTATQQTKTATALAARNRDQHVKQMLRHWFAQSTARRAVRLQAPPDTEPDSPSLRPASRAASRTRSAAGAERFRSPARRPVGLLQSQSTPAYAQTPSRARRSASRFRPIPTPAPYTPFAFDTAYLTTTPAPLGTVVDSSPPVFATAATTAAATAEAGGNSSGMAGLTPQITPFARKLRAGGFAGSMPPSVLRSSVFGRSTGPGGTGKSVRFAGGSRFRTRMAGTERGQGFGSGEQEEGDEEGRGEHLKSS